MYRINDRTVMVIAFGAVFAFAGWYFRSELTATQSRWLTTGLVILGMIYHIYVRGLARQIVIERRRLYKELWKREFDKDGRIPLKKFEEELVVFLGRLKSQSATVMAMAVLALGFLYFYGSNNFAFVMALGLWFLPARLHLIARSLDRDAPRDSEKPFPFSGLADSKSNNYQVTIDLKKVHDFILPSHALPFWTLEEAEWWLKRCGFRKVTTDTWVVDKASLTYLEADEIVSLIPL